ncbi:unnamed protein product [Closterium sp. Naga37s-1]|nr:unnamed protein product [Closterium sp. Naga37s-1]
MVGGKRLLSSFIAPHGPMAKRVHFLQQPCPLKGLSMDVSVDAVLHVVHPFVVPQANLNVFAPSCSSTLQVGDCISSNNLKDVSMDAPDDAVLRLAQLALSCTVERTASRPSMATIANELQGIRHEVVGKEELSAAIKVDVQAQEMRSGTSFPNDLASELQAIRSMEEECNGEQSGSIRSSS